MEGRWGPWHRSTMGPQRYRLMVASSGRPLMISICEEEGGRGAEGGAVRQLGSWWRDSAGVAVPVEQSGWAAGGEG